MEINITITGLNNNKALEVLNLLNGTGVAATTAPVAPSMPAAAPVTVSPAPLPPAMPSVNDDEDDNSTMGATVEGQVDAEGLPWDERIHSSNKKKKADGTWNKKRGVKESEILSVEAELRAITPQATPVVTTPAMVAYGVAPAAPLPLPPAIPVVAAVAEVAAPAPLPVAPAPLTAPVVVPAALHPTLPIGRDFSGVLTRIQRGCQAGKITAPWINQNIVGAINAQPAFGVQMNDVMSMSQRPDIIDYTHQILDVNGL